MRKFTRVFKFAHPIEIKGAGLHGIVSRMGEEHPHLERRETLCYYVHIQKNVTWEISRLSSICSMEYEHRLQYIKVVQMGCPY